MMRVLLTRAAAHAAAAAAAAAAVCSAARANAFCIVDKAGLPAIKPGYEYSLNVGDAATNVLEDITVTAQ